MGMAACAAGGGHGSLGGNHHQILAVNLQSWMALSLRNVFPRSKYDIKFINNSADVALTAISSNADVVIIDIGATGHNDISVLRQFRSLTNDVQSIVKVKEVPIFAICDQHGMDDVVRDARSLRIAGWLTKPVVVRDVLKKIEDLLMAAPKVGKTGVKTILAVDGETRVLSLYESIFSDMKNCELVTVDNAMAALEQIEFRNPDLIITENNLPDMSGLELAETIVEGKLNIPIIFVTSTQKEEFVAEAKRYGASDVVVKPFVIDQLKSRVMKVLMGAHEESQAPANAMEPQP